MTGENAPGGLFSPHQGAGTEPNINGWLRAVFGFIDERGKPWPVCEFEREGEYYHLVGVGETELA